MTKPKHNKPTSSEFNALKDWLITQGFQQAELDAALGSSVANRSRAQIAAQLTTHLKGLKKKK